MRCERADQAAGLSWRADGHGVVRESTPSTLKVTLNGDLRTLMALQRRGFALELAELLDYTVYLHLINRYLRELVTDPVPGYSRIGWEQIKRTDLAFFLRLSDRTQGALKRDSLGQMPLDAIFKELLEDQTIFYLLNPLPASSHGS
eukprot:5365778-Amphidinium_carterae.1